MSAENLQGNYDKNAAAYTQFLTTPLGTLEKQLFELSITACTGLKVLDLGGGTGLRARDALNAGAAAVDVIDISHEMMHQGQEYEKSINRDRITWYHGDASKSLDHLPLGPYDMVIANGLFDHAHDIEELEKMWHNAAAHLKPGGRLVVNRNYPFSRAAAGKEGKYGVVFEEFRDVPGGVAFKYRMKTEPPLVFEPTMLEAYYSEEMTLAKKYFQDFRIVPWEDTPVVRENRDFWEDYLADPILYIYTATRKPA